MGIFQFAQTKVDPPDAITPEERRIWEHPPDPKIKWALEILEPDPPIKESIWARTMWPSIGVAHGMGFVIWNRYRKALPLYTGLLSILAASALGLGVGEAIWRYAERHRNNEMAMIKHYLMLHPERFPEPEQVKIGDKRVFYPWGVMRSCPTKAVDRPIWTYLIKDYEGEERHGRPNWTQDQW